MKRGQRQLPLFDDRPQLDAPIGQVDQWVATRAGGPLIGVDEVGRGPLAGPVVAAAVRLEPCWVTGKLTDLDDSKRLSAATRRRLARLLAADPRIRIGVGIISPAIIDQINILEASRRAMREAIAALGVNADRRPLDDWLLVDGHLPLPGHPADRQLALVKGDRRSHAIAAASIIAKETRDQLMRIYDHRWPAYGFATHKGYGTRAHRAALTRLGPSPIHRESFRWSAPSD